METPEALGYKTPLTPDKGTEGCAGCWNIGTLTPMVKDICLGTIREKERERIADNMSMFLELAISHLSDDEKDKIRHYTNNSLQSYQMFAIDYPKLTGINEPQKEIPGGSKVTPCQLHKVIAGILALLDSQDRKRIDAFLHVLNEHYDNKSWSATQVLVLALTEAHKQ